MRINLITISSSLAAHRKVRTIHSAMITALEKKFEVHYYNEENLKEVDAEKHFTLVWIASGGTEQKFTQLYPQLPHPIYLINDGISNSLAASLEIASWLQREKCPYHILHDSSEKIAKQIDKYAPLFTTYQKLKGQRIGVIGKPSDWLIASNVANETARQRWGVEFVSLNLEDIYPLYDAISEKEVNDEVNEFQQKAIAQQEGDRNEIVKAMRLYKALAKFCKQHQLNALTLRCFGLIDYTKTTGCLALALLNRDGVIAGCEGDMQTVLSLAIAKAATGQTGFMANPSMIDLDKNEIVLSHCMIDTTLPKQYIIRSHYETLSGIAIQGVLPLGKITIFKTGGIDLKDYFISGGELIENTVFPNFCRTQARFHLTSSVNYFLTQPIGNHHVILWGDHTQVLQELFEK